MEASGPFGNAEETPVDPQPVAMIDVVLLRLVRVANVDRLGGREVAGL